jgi:nitroreductase
MSKRAPTDHPIHELLAMRWSPVAFDPERRVTPEEVRSLFEAARWAPSSFNEQPWRFVVARREEEETFARILRCLVEANQAWARHAGVLALTATATTFARNGKPNVCAWHDVGLAAAHLTVEATSRGMIVHQMAGVHRDAAREELGISDGFDVVTAIAIGHLGDGSALPDDVRRRDAALRTRRPLGQSVFGGTWGEAAPDVA